MEKVLVDISDVLHVKPFPKEYMVQCNTVKSAVFWCITRRRVVIVNNTTRRRVIHHKTADFIISAETFIRFISVV
jgi:hypothetical protein